MCHMSALLFFVFLLISRSTARAQTWDGPHQTSPQQDLAGWTPKPTERAVLPKNDLVQLVGRELTRNAYGYRTCGYWDGPFGRARVCGRIELCMSNSVHNVVGCCKGGEIFDCAIPTSCAESPDDCTSGGCDDFVTSCTNPYRPYCRTNFYTFGAESRSEVFCASFHRKESILHHTYRPPSLTRIELKRQLGNIHNFSNPPPKPTSAGDSGTPIGAIVGGAVGGVAVLLIFAGVVTWLCLRQRRRAHDRDMGYHDAGPRLPDSPQIIYQPVNTQEPPDTLIQPTMSSVSDKPGPPAYNTDDNVGAGLKDVGGTSKGDLKSVSSAPEPSEMDVQSPQGPSRTVSPLMGSSTGGSWLPNAEDTAVVTTPDGRGIYEMSADRVYEMPAQTSSRS